MKKGLECWAIFQCEEENCPAYRLKECRCWLIPGTHCRRQLQGKFLEKIEMCLECEAFDSNIDPDSMGDTLKMVSNQFQEFRRMVEERDRELEDTSMELALGLSEVFEALKRISSGDPMARIPESSELELIAKLKHMVNLTAKELGEIVDLSHEFAIGLAEHFDVLLRVSKGQLGARVSGASEIELLESLKKVTNQMIESVSAEIHERQRAGSELLKKKDEMETILNGIQDFILVITPDRKIVEANEPFLRMMGYSRKDVIGRKCHEVFRKAEQPCSCGDVICPLTTVITDKEPIQQIRQRVDHNGETRYIEVTMFPIWERDGKISKFIEISRDITERKREEEKVMRRLEHMVEERTEQLRETHAQLLHKDKMSSLGKLSASVVHEINNPIAGVLNLIMLIKRIMEEGPTDQSKEQFRDYLNLMETETRRISRIVSNLLAFSRQSKIEMKPFDLNRLIEKTLVLNSNLFRINRVQTKKDLSENLPQIYGSEDQLQQAFMNFVSNAAEAVEGKGGGTLEITTSYSPETNLITIIFRDTGVGIPAENLSMLFEPFFTTKKKGKGVGLGLSVAYGIIQEHGGAIQVESTVGEGTTFEVQLPLRPPSEPASKHGGPHG